MKHLLIISYFFPPDGGAGTQRAAKFCKYLADFGWSVAVIARQPDSARLRMVPPDTALLSDIGDQTQVIRIAETAQPGAWAAGLPRIDIAYGWLEPALAAAEAEIAARRPDAVLLTMSPFSLAFIGQRLRQVTGVPIIYDLRDPWALDGWRLHGTRWRWQRDYRVMRQTIAAADGVIANTPAAECAIAAAAPTLRPERITTIPNGYDAEDFAPPLSEPAGPRDSEFRLVHTGTLHCDCLYAYRGPLGWLKRIKHYRPEPIDTSGRTPVHLLRAIRILRERGDPNVARLRVILVAGDDADTRRCVRESPAGDCVQLTGYVSHPDSVRHIREADALFLPLHGLPAGRRSLIVPGKTYEYLATGRPILGCLPAGDARDLVQRGGRAFCADPCRPTQIAAALAELLAAWRGGQFERPAPAPWLARFERRALTQDLARFLEAVTSRHSISTALADFSMHSAGAQPPATEPVTAD